MEVGFESVSISMRMDMGILRKSYSPYVHQWQQTMI